MEKLRVYGGKKINGSINISTSKNAILPILAGSVLCDDEVILKKIPNFSDIQNMCKILQSIGASIVKVDDTIYIKTKYIDKFFVDYELGKDIRASIIFLGSILTRFKKCVIGRPGGCSIGSRPINLHIEALKSLGVTILEEHGYLYCNADNAHSGTIKFEKQSVGATENLMLFSCLLNGKTNLKNCAKEPEIVDLANFLNSMGAKIFGAGTSDITIYGVDKLHSTTYTPIGDRIIAGTYLACTAMCGGNVEICNINPKHLEIVLKKLGFCGCNIATKNDKIYLTAEKRCNALKSLTTGVFPKFPTDLQSVFLSLLAVSKGQCNIRENLFDGRFKQVPYLLKMGADIEVVCNMAKVRGVEKLSGADVSATDLRAGASLVLAGLVADGYTTIDNIHFIDRGYDHIEKDLSLLGAEIERIR